MKAKALVNYAKVVSNQLQSRFDLLDSMFGGTYSDQKMDNECGYPMDITPSMYKAYYKREGIAARVVGIFPDECWRKKPEIADTEDAKLESPFEKAVLNLNLKNNFFSYLRRVDELSGIGRFGILLIGIDDGLELDQPVEGIDENGEGDGTDTPDRKLLYFRPFDESLVTINRFEVNPASSRFGKPLFYSVNFIDTTQWGSVAPIGQESLTMKRIHWTRVIHVAENTSSSEVYGMPRMEKVFNRLFDLKKICGGSAEMFWKGGYPGLALEVNPDMLDVELDKESVDREMRAYQSGLKRYLAMTGISAKTLAPGISDPTPHLNLQLQCIALSIKCPLRVFTGTEQGVLAGSQDATAWNSRVEARREDHIDTQVLRPTIDRLIAMRVLPLPEVEENETYRILWKELSAPDEQTQSTIIATKTSALAQYVSSQVDNLIPPVDYFVHIFGMTTDEAQAIVDSAEKHLGVSLDEVAGAKMDQQLQGGDLQLETQKQAMIPDNPEQSPATNAEKGTKTGKNDKLPANRKGQSDVMVSNMILKKALIEQTCQAIEDLAANDLGEKWSAEKQTSPAAAMSRIAITANVEAEEENYMNNHLANRVIMMHNEAAEELAQLGAKTSAMWHLNRAQSLSRIYYSDEDMAHNATSHYDPSQPRAKNGEWTKQVGGVSMDQFYGNKNKMIQVKLLKESFKDDKGKTHWRAVDEKGKPINANNPKPRVWITSEGKSPPMDVNKLPIESPIPPGWHSVMVNPDPKHKLQAIGVDAADKIQPKYHLEHTAKQSGGKFSRIDNMISSGEDRAMMVANDKILATTPPSGDSKSAKKLRWQHEDAQVLSLISATGVRIGGSELNTVATHDSFGAVDFEGRHVKQKDGSTYLNYVPGKKRGKKGKAPEKVWVKIQDPAVARMVTGLAKMSGPKTAIFPSATTATVSAHIKSLNPSYSAKDFRTVVATRAAMQYVSSSKVHGRFNSVETYEAWLEGMLKHVAIRIPDSSEVLRKSYVSPKAYGHLTPTADVYAKHNTSVAKSKAERAAKKRLKVSKK